MTTRQKTDEHDFYDGFQILRWKDEMMFKSACLWTVTRPKIIYLVPVSKIPSSKTFCSNTVRVHLSQTSIFLLNSMERRLLRWVCCYTVERIFQANFQVLIKYADFPNERPFNESTHTHTFWSALETAP